MLFLLPLTLQAVELKKTVTGLTEVLENPQVSAEDCVEREPAGAMKSPKIKKGEVKISYNCDDFPAPETESKENKLEKETIKFYLGPDLGEELSIRTRENKVDKSKKDVTVKFRPSNQETPMSFDEAQYKALKTLDDAEKIDLKCEADVSYGVQPAGLKTVNSCSVTKVGLPELSTDHLAFAKMATGKELKGKLADYKTVTIESVSWKQPHASFEKGLSFEKWVLEGGICILEASAKFEATEETPAGVKASSIEAMQKLKLAVEEKFPKEKRPAPSSEQGNKTNRATNPPLPTKPAPVVVKPTPPAKPIRPAARPKPAQAKK